jgi:DNA-binding response OmpR family regulator
MKAKLILIIDDDVLFIKMLSVILKDLGQINTVTSLYAAEQFLSCSTPDIIICDNHLGDGMGLKFIAKLKRKAATCRIPMVLVTASSDPDNELEALEAGADEYLQKPINAKIAFLRIKNCMN